MYIELQERRQSGSPTEMRAETAIRDGSLEDLADLLEMHQAGDKVQWPRGWDSLKASVLLRCHLQFFKGLLWSSANPHA